VLYGDLLDRFAASDRFHDELPQAESIGSGLELATVGVALAHLLRRRLRIRQEPPIRGGAPLQRVTTINAVKESQTTVGDVGFRDGLSDLAPVLRCKLVMLRYPSCSFSFHFSLSLHDCRCTDALRLVNDHHFSIHASMDQV